jgi:uncharacterized protein YjbI with pentapeptide repeats
MINISRGGRHVPKFYFDIAGPNGIVEDFEGTELPDLDTARLEGIEDARAIMSQSILNGVDVSGRHLNIRNDERKLLLRVTFSEAFISEG